MNGILDINIARFGSREQWYARDEKVQTAIAKYATAVRSCNTAWVDRLRTIVNAGLKMAG